MEYMFMPLKRYAEFSGRSRRMEYWMWALFLLLLNIAFWVLMMVVGGAAMMTGGGNPGALLAAGGGIMILVLLFGLISLGLIIPNIAVGVRRLHDTDRTGWWLLAPLIPYILIWVGTGMAVSNPGSPGTGGIVAMIGGIGVFVLAITLLVFMFLDGTKGPNRFGPDPKARTNEEVFA
jgi:uncharacterized membrane protein YhaH (DUF805 family)